MAGAGARSRRGRAGPLARPAGPVVAALVVRARRGAAAGRGGRLRRTNAAVARGRCSAALAGRGDRRHRPARRGRRLLGARPRRAGPTRPGTRCTCHLRRHRARRSCTSWPGPTSPGTGGCRCCGPCCTPPFGLVLRHRVLGPLRGAVRHRLRVEAWCPRARRGLDRAERPAPRRAGPSPGSSSAGGSSPPDTWRTAHPFSLSAPPTPDRLRLTVKALGDGSRAAAGLEVGTWVVGEGPYGALTAARRTRRDVLLIAGGVGITPMRALFETLPMRTGEDLMLLYRARRPEEISSARSSTSSRPGGGPGSYYLLGDDPAAGLERLVHPAGAAAGLARRLPVRSARPVRGGAPLAGAGGAAPEPAARGAVRLLGR